MEGTPPDPTVGPPGQPPPQPPPAPSQPPPPAPGYQPPPVYQPPPAQQYGGPVPPGGWQQPPAKPLPSGELASWGPRLGAWLIDALILFVPGAVALTLLIVGTVAASEDDSGSFVPLLVLTIVVGIAWIVAFFLYAPLLMKREGANNGQTLGKQVTDVRVVRRDGQPVNFGTAMLREVVLKNIAVSIASSVIPLIPWFLNFFWPLWDDENRALHDMAANTWVVKA